MLLLLFINLIYSQIPQCSYVCNSVSCDAVCSPICSPIDCTVICNPSDVEGVCNSPKCHIEFSSNQNILQECPLAEILCDELRCSPLDRPCEIQCQEIQCSWDCKKPSICPLPDCILECEPAACQFSSDSKLSISFIINVLLLFINKLLI